jgi:hypothetical protein
MYFFHDETCHMDLRLHERTSKGHHFAKRVVYVLAGFINVDAFVAEEVKDALH